MKKIMVMVLVLMLGMFCFAEEAAQPVLADFAVVQDDAVPAADPAPLVFAGSDSYISTSFSIFKLPLFYHIFAKKSIFKFAKQRMLCS